MGKSDPKWSRHYRHHERYLGHQGYLAMSLAAKGAHDLLCHLAGQAWGEDRRAGGSMTIGAKRRIRRNDAVKWLATKGVDMSQARAVVRELYDAGLAKDDTKDGAMILCEWIDHQVSDSRSAKKKRAQRAGGARPKRGDSGGDMSPSVSPPVSRDSVGDMSPQSKVEVERRDLRLSNFDSKDSPAGVDPPEASRPGPPSGGPPSTSISTSTGTCPPKPSHPPGTCPVNGNGKSAEAHGAQAPSTSIRHGGPPDGGPGRDWSAWGPDDPVNLASRLTGECGSRSVNTWAKALRELGDETFRTALAEVREAARAGHAQHPARLLNHVLRRKREERV